jgi:hypothetical protein
MGIEGSFYMQCLGQQELCGVLDLEDNHSGF